MNDAGLPPLVRELTDQQLLALSDGGSFSRGRAYHRGHRVLELEDLGTSVTGQVVGSGRIYTTTVSIVGGTSRRVSDDCTCPIGRGCKHVVALVLTARDRAPAASLRARLASADRLPDWERLLDDALPEVLPASGRALALLVTLGSSRYDGPASLSLQPFAEGARGGWVKTGVGWHELEYARASYGGTSQRTFAPEQLEAVRAIGRAGRGGGSYSFYRTSTQVSVADLGAAFFALLSCAEEAGVALLDSPRNGRRVRLIQEPGRLLATARAPDDGGPGSVTVELELPWVAEPGAATWHDLADSSHDTVGWVAQTPDGLALVRAERPLDLARRRLLTLGTLPIPAADWPRFAMTRLPTLRRLVTTDVDGEVEVGPPRLALLVTHHPGHRSDVRTAFAYTYPGADPVFVAPVSAGEPMRDPRAERDLVTRLRDRLSLPSLWRQPDILADSATFVGLGVADLVAVLDDLRDSPDVLLSQEGTPASYAESLEPPIITVSTVAPAAAAGDHTDWFDLEVSVTVGGEDVSLAELISALATGRERLLLASGRWFSLDRPELRQLASALAEARMLQDKPSETLRITPLHAGLWEQLVEIGVVAEQSAEWQSRIAALTDLTLRESIAPPEGLAATLRDYQLDGYRWLSALWDASLGGVLADDMGLGKTLQLLAAVQRAKELDDLADPVLIVCPTSVIGTWLHEAERFCPALDVRALDTTRHRAGETLTDAVAGADLVVTSFALLRIDEEEFRTRSWSALVLDEAQFVKNHRSKVYAAARRVPARRTFALTGTPLENSLMDLWSLLSLAAPGLYPRPDRFKEHYAIPIERQGAVEELAALRRRIRPLLMRRTKEAVATELPPKQETLLHVPMARKHRSIYDRHLDRERQRILGLVDDLDSQRIAVLRALTVLRQMSLDPGLVDPGYAGVASPAKVDVLVEQLVELAAEGHRALVFSQFTGFLRLVRERLDAEGIDYCYLDGRTRKREETLRRFREGDQAAFLISLKAGGFGLTLTEADYVFVLDPWWNPAAEMQAIDRTHRIGQDKPVNVYRLVSTDTVEEKVVALQQRKRDLFRRVVEDEAVFAGALTADDIRTLLAP